MLAGHTKVFMTDLAKPFFVSPFIFLAILTSTLHAWRRNALSAILVDKNVYMCVCGSIIHSVVALTLHTPPNVCPGHTGVCPVEITAGRHG